ncbi:MAG: rhomboid family intramembrane serine protease [Lacibacter sp.]
MSKSFDVQHTASFAAARTAAETELVLLAALHRTFGGALDSYTGDTTTENGTPRISYSDDLLQLTATWDATTIQVTFSATVTGAWKQKRRQRYVQHCSNTLGYHLAHCVQEWEAHKKQDLSWLQEVAARQQLQEMVLNLNRNSRNTLVAAYSGPAWGTYGIILASVVVFVITAFYSGSLLRFTSAALLQTGGLYNISFFNGAVYRLFTALFVHDGLMHLFANMLLLLIWGSLIEPLFGKWRLVLVFVTTGILTFMFSLLLRHNQFVLMYGASSGVLGVLGFALTVFYRIKTPPLQYYLFNFQMVLLVLLLLVGNTESNVDIIGHISGFAAGMVLGLLFPYNHHQFSNMRQRTRALALCCILLLSGAGGLLWLSPQNAVAYSRLYEQSTQQIDALFDETDTAADSSFTLLQQRAAENDAAYRQLLQQLNRLQQYKQLDSTHLQKAALLLQITRLDYDWFLKIPATDSAELFAARQPYMKQREVLLNKLHQEE